MIIREKSKMKSTILGISVALFLSFATVPAYAKASCETLIAEIEAKLASKGVTKFTLLIIPKDEATDSREVGTCDGGAKKIIYKRG
jgi:Protein of unknown function (DUF1161)